MGWLATELLAEIERVEVVAISRASILFILLTIGLVILFIGLLLLTRPRRRLRSSSIPAEAKPPVDPWKESANRVRIDERDSDDAEG